MWSLTLSDSILKEHLICLDPNPLHLGSVGKVVHGHAFVRAQAQAGLTPVSTMTSGSEHIDEFCTRFILLMCKYGAPGLGCNQGVFVNTSMVFDLENSEGDGLVR